MSWIALEGAVNVRDVGGLPTVDGRSTRPGVLVRADNLQDLTPGDVVRLTRDHGVRTVLDLRTDAERQLEGPTQLQRTDVAHHGLSLVPHRDGDSEGDDLARAIPHREGRRGESPTDMTGYYVGYLEDAPKELATALRLLADPVSGTTVVHCAAGKDRTGVVVAVALSLAGVTRTAVVEDYVASAQVIDRILHRLQGRKAYGELGTIDVADITPQAGSMERFLDHVDRAYGGPHGLALAIGLDEETVARLVRRLVGPSPHGDR
ncbi:MAG: protein tyrosine phosphatase [Frankiales bacterium]|nr:protein tyrosine phosphatase [Frankiales bacterium]